MVLSAVAAALVPAAGACVVAALPDGTTVPLRVGLPLTALGTFAATAALLPDDPVRSGFALAVAGLGVTLSFAVTDPGFGGLRGGRLRLARAVSPLLLAAALASVLLSDPGVGLLALAGCALLATAATGCTRGQAASLAGWRLLRLQAVAIGGGVLGVAVGTLSAPAGAALVGLAAAALAGAAPFGGALARASARTAPPLAAMVAGLLPLAAFGVLLRARAALLQEGFGSDVDCVLLGSGLLAILLGAALVARRLDRRDGQAASRTALSGLVLVAFGIGGTGAAYAGLVCLLALSVAAPAAILAGTLTPSRLRTATLLFAAAAPPSGLFAGTILLVEASGRLAPLPALALCPLLTASVGRRIAVGTESGGWAVRFVLVAHAAASLAIGIAMPAPVGARLFDMAAALSGGG